MKEKEQSNLNHVIARRQAKQPHWAFSRDVIASDQRERRNRHVGEIQRLCDYDVAIAVLDFDNSQKRGFARLDVLGGLRRTAHLSKSAPRNDNTFPRHCEEGKPKG